MRELQREKVWERAAERLVQLPGTSPEIVGGLLADAFAPIFLWERGEERSRSLRTRADARRRLREMIESRLPVKLP